MRKKSAKKSAPKSSIKRTRITRRKAPSSFQYSRYLIISFAVLMLVFVASFGKKAVERPHVLGASIYLAHGGDDSSSSPGSDTSGSNSGSGSTSSGGSTESSGGTETSGGNETETQTSTDSNISSNTLVDCVGPDGKHFSTTFEACKKLNEFWHHSNFTFTLLQRTTHNTLDSSSGQSQNHQEGSRGHKKALTVELEQAGDKLDIRAKNEDGSDSELEGQDALDQLNESLEDDDMHVGTTSGNKFTFRKGEVEAETHFPLTVDPITHTLTVTTPAGTKQVAILPDQAVQNILQRRLMDSIENESTEISSGSATSLEKVVLTSLNDQPVFAVKGVANKRFLGLVPISFAKTAFVSTDNGDVVQVDETLLSRFLEIFSF